MSVQHRSLLGPANPFDDGQPAVTHTGATEPMDSSDALSSELSRRNNSEAAYRASQANALGVTDAGATGLELEHSDDRTEDAELDTTGMVVADSNLMSTTTIGDEGPLVQSTGAGDVQRDTGQSGGRAII
jgi:hypothetical protein